MLTLILLSLAAQAATRHPCTPAEDLGADRYARKSMIIFPVEMTEGARGEKAVKYTGKDPQGAPLPTDEALYLSVAEGLFMVDYPLLRFDTWLAPAPPLTSGGHLSSPLAEVGEALRCTDVAIVPRVTGYQAERKAGKEGAVEISLKVSMELSVWERDGATLVEQHVLRTKVPGIVDSVEDVMVDARTKTVDKLRQQAQKVKKVEKAAAKAEDLLSELPLDQAERLAEYVHGGRLALNRVASIARPVRVVPVLAGRSHPAQLGLAWREQEDACYLNAPKPDEDGAKYEQRVHECAALSRIRQAVRDLQLQTRRVPEFRLFARTTPFLAEDGVEARRVVAFPLGDEEGLRVGDGYWLMEPGTEKRNGYARVRASGPGGAFGGREPSQLTPVWCRGEAVGLTAQEYAQLGIEVGPWAGPVVAARPAAQLPDGSNLEQGRSALAGSLRFDVNLGPSLGWYETYETNRLQWAFAGPLSGSMYAFGLEKRFLVLPRTYLASGAALGYLSWSIPSGHTYTDDKGNEQKIRANAQRFGAVVDVGAVLLVHPSVSLRLDFGGRLFKGVDEFKWSHEDEKGTVTPETEQGDFHLRTTGLHAGLSAAWVF